MSTFQDIQLTAGKLLRQIGCTEKISLHPISGGSNNRVVRVDCEEQKFFLKSFFHDASDPRDRFATELAFTQFAWQKKICGAYLSLSPRTAHRAVFSIRTWREGQLPHQMSMPVQLIKPWTS